ncbi:MAG: sugar phosphorylase [Anaerolineae bacterium]|nr:sugar phosphorylase [Anaerolineae bacterium]
MKELLNLLYGGAAAEELEPRIDALLREYAPRIQDAVRKHPPPPIDQKTALLITYGDQVTSENATPLRTLGEFLDAQARDILSGVHILPFYPFSSDDGFSVKEYYAVDERLGTWDDVARVGEHFDLMFDAVINHVSAQGEWFQGFLRDDPATRDYFVVVEGNPDLSQVVRPRALPLLTTFQTPSGEKKVWTTFSADQIDLNYKDPELALRVLDILLFYVAQGARFIRLDAIAFMWKEIGTTCLHLPQTHALIQLVRAVMERAAPHVILITETNVPHADNISYFGDGTNEAHWVYNFALPPLTLHTLQTGDTTRLTHWAQTLATPSDDTAFFNFLASHDGVGLNPARGILTETEIEALVTRTLGRGGLVSYKNNPDGSRSPYEMNINYLDALTVPNEPTDHSTARMLCAHAILLSLAGVPGIYFHSLFGSRGDRAGADASGIPRRINREKLERAVLERELADPSSRRAQIFGGMRRLVRARRAHAAFHPKAAQTVLDTDSRVMVVLRESQDPASRVLCAHNVTDQNVRVTIPKPGGSKNWRDILGDGARSPEDALELGAFEVAWLVEADIAI